jgi:RimJ/RimL family protein N-acetyltransferase
MEIRTERSVDLVVRRMTAADDQDAFVHTVCSPLYTSRHYGETREDIPRRFLGLHFGKAYTAGSSTCGADIWLAVDGDVVVGYYTMLRKRWGTVKSSTFIVKNEYQRRGIGRRIHDVVEAHYDHCPGVRKLYHTAPVGELGHLRLDLEFGYRIEGHLRSHFLEGRDELVMGRFPRVPLVRPKSAVHDWPRDLNWEGDVSVAGLSGPTPDGLCAEALRWVRWTHDRVDAAWIQSQLSAAIGRWVAGDADAPRGVAALMAKRVRLGKLVLWLDPTAPSGPAVRLMVRSAVAQAQTLRLRKLYVEVPTLATELKLLLAEHGFVHEATLESPYKHAVDMELLSSWLTT